MSTILICLASCAATTPFSPANLDLDSLILQPQDLPAGFTAGPIQREVPEMLSVAPPALALYQPVSERELKSEGITVLVYEEMSQVEAAYQAISQHLDAEKSLQPLAGVGEKAMYYEDFTNGYLSSYTTKVVFQRCRAVIFISLFSPEAKAGVVTNYAQELDRRLQPQVCF